MTQPTRDYELSKPESTGSTKVTGGMELHRYINNKRTAEILRERGVGHLAGAFDSGYQNK